MGGQLSRSSTDGSPPALFPFHSVQGESLERYFHAFDIEGNGSVDVREFLLGLAASDPSVKSVATHGCEQWERIRLEGIFQLYDADADGVIDAKDFSVMVRCP